MGALPKDNEGADKVLTFQNPYTEKFGGAGGEGGGVAFFY